MILFNGKTCYMHFNIAHNPLITEGTKKRRRKSTGCIKELLIRANPEACDACSTVLQVMEWGCGSIGWSGIGVPRRA